MSELTGITTCGVAIDICIIFRLWLLVQLRQALPSTTASSLARKAVLAAIEAAHQAVGGTAMEQVILIALDASEQANHAFECKYQYIQHCRVFKCTNGFMNFYGNGVIFDDFNIINDRGSMVRRLQIMHIYVATKIRV